MASNLFKYVGKVTGANIIDNTGFDSLNKEKVFIRRELTLVMKDGTKIPLANPEFLEFSNSTSGREALKESGIDQTQIDAVMLMWGDEPVVEDPSV